MLFGDHRISLALSLNKREHTELLLYAGHHFGGGLGTILYVHFIDETGSYLGQGYKIPKEPRGCKTTLG